MLEGIAIAHKWAIGSGVSVMSRKLTRIGNYYMTATHAPQKKSKKPFPQSLKEDLEIIIGENNIAYAVIRTHGNPYVVAMGSGEANTIIRNDAQDAGKELRNRQMAEINEMLTSYAESLATKLAVWNRVAPLPGGGVEIDMGDPDQTRYQITANTVKRVETGSENLFIRSPLTRPFVTPSERPDLGLLKKYLNMDEASATLLIAWLSYTLAHPKADGTKYVHLVVQGPQGSGKSVFSKNIVQRLIDPSAAGLQMFPRDQVNLAITCQGSHLTAFDNMRDLTTTQSDMLCTLATRGTIVSRKLYTNDSKSVVMVHGPAMFNGIHEFIRESDLAQRCLTLTLAVIDPSKRKADADLMRELDEDLPHIFAGLLERISKIFARLPEAEVIYPERMIEFSNWLAASELVDGVSAGTYQKLYSDMVTEGQLDSIMDNPLVVAVAGFVDSLTGRPWKGTPTQLLHEIAAHSPSGFGSDRTQGIPSTAIGLSKRLRSLEGGFKTLGIEFKVERGVQRTITVQGPEMVPGSVPLIADGDF